VEDAVAARATQSSHGVEPWQRIMRFGQRLTILSEKPGKPEVVLTGFYSSGPVTLSIQNSRPTTISATTGPARGCRIAARIGAKSMRC